MTIASRTPEGMPGRCPICDAEFSVVPSQPFGDAPCPACGARLWFAHLDGETWLLDSSRADRDQLLQLERQIAAGHSDSLDMVELVMQLEEMERDEE